MKDGEIIGIIVENINVFLIHCVIITVNHEFEVFNVCGPRLILLPDANNINLGPQQTLNTSNP